MSITNTWTSAYENAPADTVAANTLDTIIQGLKQDIRERADEEHLFSDIGQTATGRHKATEHTILMMEIYS